MAGWLWQRPNYKGWNSRVRFSLRHLFVLVTVVAVSLVLGMAISDWIKPLGHGYSPDQDGYWLDWFYRGDKDERQTAIRMISVRARKDKPGQRLIRALCDASNDDDRYVRLDVIAGLDRTAKTNDAAKAVLKRLAEGDPDDRVRATADYALNSDVSLEGATQ